MDPKALIDVNWSDTGSILLFIWMFVIAVVGFASFMLMAHAIIPSLLASGHIPEGLRNIARKQRFPMYLSAIVMLGVISFWLAMATDAAHEIRRFWPRDWI